MASEKEGFAGEAPPSYDSAVQPTVPPGYPPPQQSGYPPPQASYPPPQGGYPPPQASYPPPQSGYPPPPQSGYPAPQASYPPPQGGYPPPPTGYPPQQFPPVESDHPPPTNYPPQQYPPAQGVVTVTQSTCNACNMQNYGGNGLQSCLTSSKGRKCQFIYMVAAVIVIIILGATIRPFPEGPFPQAALIPFVVFTIIVNLMFYVPATIQKARYPHSCERKNEPICC